MTMPHVSGFTDSIWIAYASEPAKRLADFIRADLEWLLEMRIPEAEPAPRGTVPAGENQVIVTILLTPYMETSWKAVIHSMKRGMSRIESAGVGGRLILRDREGGLRANFLFQSQADAPVISDLIKTMLAT